MKTIYIVNVRMSDCNGSIIHVTACAYTNSDKASELCNEMNEQSCQDDPNFMAYVTGPVPLIEED